MATHRGSRPGNRIQTKTTYMSSNEPSDKAVDETDDINDETLTRELVLRLLERNEDYLSSQENQSIELDRQIIAIAAISTIPLLVNANNQGQGHLGKILRMLGIIFLAISVVLALIDLIRVRKVTTTEASKLQDIPPTNEYSFNLGEILKYRVVAVEDRKRVQKKRIIWVKISYVCYAVAFILILLSYQF